MMRFRLIDKSTTEIISNGETKQMIQDRIAIDTSKKTLRFGSCKR